MQLNPNCDSLRNLNVDGDVLMKGWPEEIPDISVYGLSIYGSHIKCDVFNNYRYLGMINMRNPYAIGDWKTPLGIEGHKEGILAREDK